MRQERPGINGEEFVAVVMRDVEISALSPQEKVLFRFVDRVNHESPSITAEDMAPLHEAGWDDTAIYYALTVCALFNFYNRWIDASGVHALPDEVHRAAGKRSAVQGYVRK